MNTIEKVAELKNLEEKVTPGPWKQEDNVQSETVITNGETEIFDDGSSNGEYAENFRFGDPDPTFICEMRNAAPVLLNALGKIQVGDAELLDSIAIWFACSDEPEQFKMQIELLRRYRDLASQMEAMR